MTFLISVGIGRLINSLVPGYPSMLGYILLRVPRLPQSVGYWGLIVR